MHGRVQGVGFRPTVYRHAVACGLTGQVANTAAGVNIDVQGTGGAIDDFLDRLRTAPPPRAVVENILVEDLPLNTASDFFIAPSVRSGDLATGIAPDLALCADCRRDIDTPGDRRFGYPFVNCTNCGPRFTIMAALPYDRERTSMAGFQMCSACNAEFTSPIDRRFDAQPNACPVCGPAIRLCHATGDPLPRHGDHLDGAAALLSDGAIVAIKGLGGYHIACDANNVAAIDRLRTRKQRPAKPFAVMFADIAGLRRQCTVTDDEVDLLTSSMAPIVIVRKGPDYSLAPAVAPDASTIGAFLPYTPLHHLLLKRCGPLVMTSGNLTDEPIACDEVDMARQLGSIAEYALVHNRPILRRCDDSVIQLSSAGPVFMRRSRGWVPAPVRLPRLCRAPVLAIGADLKNVFGITRADRIFLSQHIGDLDTVAALDFHGAAIDDLLRLLGVDPVLVATDMHPNYNGVRAARRRWGDRCRAVQHHHAHIASCMADNMFDGPVIGLALDGTGFGPDGAIWGGEILYTRYDSFERLGHFKSYRLPGGDAAVINPARMALSCLAEDMPADTGAVAARLLPAIGDDDRAMLLAMLARGVNAPLTTSAGRMFDAVAALCGVCAHASYEGQAAIRLQALAESHHGAAPAFDFEIDSSHTPFVISFAPAIRDIVTGRCTNIPVALLAARFHATVTAALAAACDAARTRTGCRTVALSGGVFQNRHLLEHVCPALEARGFDVLRHCQVSPNDSGLALGQAMVVMAQETAAGN